MDGTEAQRRKANDQYRFRTDAARGSGRSYGVISINLLAMKVG